METRYKLILSNTHIYKEVELTSDATTVRVGTAVDCDVRLRKELFFRPMELRLVNDEGQWSVHCSDNLYLTAGDVRKWMVKKLQPGEVLEVKYQNFDSVLFRLFFQFDFDYEKKEYDTEIDISECERLTIGGGNSTIAIDDCNIGDDYLTIKKEGDSYVLYEGKTRFGVYVNGSRIIGQKEIADYDFISIANYSFYYKCGKLYTEMKHNMRCHSLELYKLESAQTSHFSYPEFVRHTRVQYSIPDTEIEIKQPLPKPQKPKKNILLSLVPSIAMLVLMIAIRGVIGNGGSFVIYSVCSMGIGIIMSVATHFYDAHDYRQAIAKREYEYKEYLKDKEQEIVCLRANELRIRNLIFTSLSESIQEVLSHGNRIFERTNRDKDFLDIYLGEGTVAAAVPIRYTEQDFADEDDSISKMPCVLEKQYHHIEHAPIVSRFQAFGVIGVVGKCEVLHRMLRNMTLDLAIRHCYNDVKVYYVLGEEDYHELQWIRWLRHAHNQEMNIWNFLCDDESKHLLLENLYTILSEREGNKKEKEDVHFDVHYVVFVLHSFTIRQHPIFCYVKDASDYDFTFVFFEEYEEFLPCGCKEIIRLDVGGHEGTLLHSENGDMEWKFTYEPVSYELAETVALKLGAISVKEAGLESELTTHISLFELLHILHVEDLDLETRWATSQVYQSMAAPIGVRAKNKVVYLDISDHAHAHGPHGLVAGTTGSGKSEILQTYVLSMATLFHPYDVGFVIIDFKGGGMANQFKKLPHMMGAITNIDGREIHRSLLSIKAELVKRQALLAKAGVNHINDYMKLFKKKEVQQPLPHLIVIVDEFAELKAEFPDFMKELISAARIGRTLGVHLILATQKPAGVVDSQIWSNSKFKLCLKVQTKEDSNEVMKTPLAAEIKEPGRAYLQVGNNEIFELFQSAYSGANVTEGSDFQSKTFSIYQLNQWGKRSLVYTNQTKVEENHTKNQLQEIVDYVASYCSAQEMKSLAGICLPPLADVIEKGELLPFDSQSSKNIVIPVGIYDDPQRQEQGNYCINLSSSHIYIVGSAMTGKTTLLQTIMLQLMTYFSPSQVQVYIIDCGNRALKAFEASKLVGGVVLSTEEEKVINLFKMLLRAMEERKRILSEKGLATYVAYLEAGYMDMPLIVLMIDNMAVFKECYEGLAEDFLTLSREGNSLGITVVATASQTNAMHYRALADYGTRIAFVCNDANEYMTLLGRCRVEPKDTVGRALCVIDKRVLEFQTALCVEGEKEYIRVENTKKLIETANARFGDVRAQPIPFVPDKIVKSEVRHTLYTKPYLLPIGMDFDTVEYAFVDLLTVGYFGITGGDDRGKKDFVKGILEEICEWNIHNPARVWVLDDERMSLECCSKYACVEQYESDEDMTAAVIEALYAEMTDRILHLKQRRGIQRDKLLDEMPLMLLVLENRQCIDYISKDATLLRKCKDVLENAVNTKMCVIFSNVEDVAVGFHTPELYKMIKNHKKTLVFEDVSKCEFVDFSIKQQKEHAKTLKQGDAFLCFGNKVNRIRTIVYERR